ncbi:alpha/beta hydrolase [Terrimonas sp. NA20]|uniref:Alpha/beta hydrolase n=1 Tax=Terrimonas ginsenosidimutans TaxID=2908004 RepID=A0ABS9KTT8_9BACT|nr:alpha/beta hydrolase [Terrimonas ginsenosidimutans]MCG2615743.1 alpha/beta hydrolase [Terrimonas ginsenosidimutans]
MNITIALMVDHRHTRRRFIAQAAMGIAASQLGALSGPLFARSDNGSQKISLMDSPIKKLEPLKFINAGVLNIAYYETGPADGPVTLLLHGFPYDIHSYVDVAPILAEKGMRVIVPYLRGFGPTRFLDKQTMRSGEQAAVGMDLMALMVALKIDKAVLAGYDWGGRAACVAAALFPQHCTGLVCVNSYLIQDIANAQKPVHPDHEVPLWYQYYFHQERGRQGLEKYRSEIANTLWKQWSPNWNFDQTTFERAATAFQNPDYVDVVIHSYRHRFGLVKGDKQYEAIQQKLATLPKITVPSITLDGDGDGVVAATNGESTAKFFTASRQHMIIPRVGHNLPQEAPEAFANAVAELANR